MIILKILNTFPKNTNFYSEQAKICMTNEIIEELKKQGVIK
jgi:hypothetical protein